MSMEIPTSYKYRVTFVLGDVVHQVDAGESATTAEALFQELMNSGYEVVITELKQEQRRVRSYKPTEV